MLELVDGDMNEGEEKRGRGRPRGTYEKEPVEVEMDAELYQYTLDHATMTDPVFRAMFARDFVFQHQFITAKIDQVIKTKRFSDETAKVVNSWMRQKLNYARTLGITESKPAELTLLD